MREFGVPLGVRLYRREFMSSCVSADLCCWGCVKQGITTRGRDLSCWTMLVFVQRPLSGVWLSQIALA